MDQNRTKSLIRLPSVLAIGFTGHRNLGDEAKCRALIFNFLRQQKASASATLYGVCSAAEGGDLAFAECCIELEIPLRILLPFPRKIFQNDFDPATWLRVEHVLSQAVSVEVTGTNEVPAEGYYQCGIETAQLSQLMIALWDGDAARGMGGTQQIVSFAEQMGKPVVWINDSTGATRILNEAAFSKLEKWFDPELEFLNSLPDGAVAPRTDSPFDLATAWFNKIDANASQLAPQTRKLSAIPILYTAAAAFFSGAGMQLPHPQTWLGIGAGLGITAAILPLLLKLKQRQILWARTRTAAEACRSVMALWAAPLTSEVIDPEALPELAGVLRSLKLLKSLDRSRLGTTVEEFKKHYRDERLSHQLEYFSKHAALSAKHAHRYLVASWLCVGIAISVSLTLFITGAFFKTIHVIPERRWLTVGVSAFFQLGTIFATLVVVYDCKRRQRHYSVLREWLIESRKEFDALETWSTVLAVANRIESALLAELLEWKSLVLNVELPRK